jgi:hypothetical protein
MASKITELSAVNQLLANIGQAPTTSLNSTNPQISLAQNQLAQINNDVQTEGWVFNTEQNYPFMPDIDGHIVIPSTVLRLDTPPNAGSAQPVIRGGKLYDKIAHSYIWSGVQEFDVVWLFDFADLPEAAKQYITLRASNLFAMRMTGSLEVAKYAEREEAAARAALLEYECNQGGYNIFSAGYGVSPVRTSNPINTILRF